MAKTEKRGTPEGMARLRHPGGAGCSFAGREYRPEKDGSVLVPAEAARHLAAHGFIAAEEEEEIEAGEEGRAPEPSVPRRG